MQERPLSKICLIMYVLRGVEFIKANKKSFKAKECSNFKQSNKYTQHENFSHTENSYIKDC